MEPSLPALMVFNSPMSGGQTSRWRLASHQGEGADGPSGESFRERNDQELGKMSFILRIMSRGKLSKWRNVHKSSQVVSNVLDNDVNDALGHLETSRKQCSEVSQTKKYNII